MLLHRAVAAPQAGAPAPDVQSALTEPSVVAPRARLLVVPLPAGLVGF